MNRPSAVARRRALLVFAAAAAACAGDDGTATAGDTPWVATADSSGDTVVIRIAGAMPASRVSTLVPELRVGAEEGREEEMFGRIGTVIGLRDGGLLVHDGQTPAVRLFDSAGAFMRNVGGKGGGPGEYNQVNGIVRLPDDRIVILDANGARLNFYSPAGDFISTAPAPMRGWFSQNILAADDSGRLYAIGVIKRDTVDYWRSTSGYVRMDGNGNVVDSIAFLQWKPPVPPLTVRSESGSASSPVPFAPANSTRLMPDGRLVSGPGDEYHLYLTGGTAKPLRIEREHARVPVSDAEASERRESTEWMMKRNNPSWTWTGAAIPTHKPAYRGIEVGGDGSIWVTLSSPGEPIPADEMPPVREGAPPMPRLTMREATVYDVFSREGRLLGRVSMPARTRIFARDARYAWGSQSDSLGVERAVRFRIEPAFAR